MAEYIEREALVSWIEKQRWPSKLLTIMAIQETPAADVAPVVHSQWEITDIDHAYGTKCYHCPECGEDEWRYDELNYCPNCGARMNGERKADDG